MPSPDITPPAAPSCARSGGLHRVLETIHSRPWPELIQDFATSHATAAGLDRERITRLPRTSSAVVRNAFELRQAAAGQMRQTRLRDRARQRIAADRNGGSGVEIA